MTTALSAAVPVLLLAACHAPRTGDREQIVDAVARLLVRPGQPVCIDSRTSGDALGVWRNVRHIVHGTAGRLGWMQPAPLVPPIDVERTVMVDGRPQTRVLEPGARYAPLPLPLIRRLETAARTPALTEPDTAVGIGAIAGAKTRWWVFNRVAASCPYAYRLSNPTQRGDLAFVAADANHWSTVYALEKSRGGWRPIARWTPWMY